MIVISDKQPTDEEVRELVKKDIERGGYIPLTYFCDDIRAVVDKQEQEGEA
jgi:hypothetical protein